MAGCKKIRRPPLRLEEELGAARRFLVSYVSWCSSSSRQLKGAWAVEIPLIRNRLAIQQTRHLREIRRLELLPLGATPRRIWGKVEFEARSLIF